jgi:hypothetical protein
LVVGVSNGSSITIRPKPPLKIVVPGPAMEEQRQEKAERMDWSGTKKRQGHEALSF